MNESLNIDVEDSNILYLTADIVSTYVSRNNVPANQLPDLIKSIHSTLTSVKGGTAPVFESKEPAVPIKKSVNPDYIICLEDGKKLKMLKRYLRTNFNMTPEEYRAKWGLANDYPMVAPNYAQRRSEFARNSGLGKVTGRKR